MFRLRQRLIFFKFTLKEYQLMKDKKDFRKILNSSQNAKYQQLRSNFFHLIKEYHPDKNIMHPNFEKGQSEEITKIITQAYTFLTNQYLKGRIQSAKKEQQQYQPSTQEDKIYYQVFKKHRYQDPYAFYKTENQYLKQQYMRRIKEMGTSSQQESYTSEKQQNKNNSQIKQHYFSSFSNSKQQNSINWLIVLTGAGLIGFGLYLYLPKHQQSNLPKLNKEQIKRYQQKWRQKIVDRTQNIVNQHVNEQAPSLIWPMFGSATLIQQLFRFTILPDIELYQVHPNVFQNYQNHQFNQKAPQLKKLDKMRPNTLMTLALEAERSLQNIYVSKSYLLNQLKTKGYFECPGIYIRYYGYIYIKLRRKPLNLQNYNGQKWISLFDLYFKYYSPVFYFIDYFDTHFTSQRDPKFFGDVHLNSRALPLYHLKPNQKNVFMWTPKGGDYKVYQQKYKNIWTNYYTYFVPLGTKQISEQNKQSTN